MKQKLYRPRSGAPKFDSSRKVRVYRNLHQEGSNGEPAYSIQQDGKVLGYAQECWIQDAKFIIQKAGQERVRREKKKYVHAFVDGFLTSPKNNYLPFTAKYDPYTDDTFVDVFDGEPVYEAMIARVGPEGVSYYE